MFPDIFSFIIGFGTFRNAYLVSQKVTFVAWKFKVLVNNYINTPGSGGNNNNYFIPSFSKLNLS